MSEPPPHARRRPSSRGTRTTGPSLAPLPRLQVPWAPLEILTPEQVERILDAACRVLEDAGLEIRSAAARDVYRKAGAIVDDATQLVRLGRDLVEAQLALAPTSFVLHSRNRERHLHVGGNTVNFGPVNGAPNATDLERGRRYGDLAAFRDILKLTHTLGVLHWQGGIVVEPVDVAIPVRHLAAYRAHIECSDIVWAARGVGGVQAEDAVAMSAIEHRCSIEDLAARPTLMSVTNVNSPRRVDEEILDNVMAMARHGQCVVITPFTLMGAMAPVTLAGALVQQTAEALGIIALCQLVRAGAPCVMGGFTSNVDMRTGSPAFGTPEYVNAALATAQIGRRLGIPVRTSAVNASPTVDAQSTYETAFSLHAAILSHSHLINHAAGWLEGGLVGVVRKDRGRRRDAACLGRDAQAGRVRRRRSRARGDQGVEPGGHFFGSAHTLARYEKAFYRPLLSDWSNFESWTGGRQPRRHASGDRDLEAPARRVLAAAARRGRARGHRRLRGAAVGRTRRAAVIVTDRIVNARMYSVTPAVEALWRELLERITTEARVPLRYVPYPAPQPLEDLWSRPDLGCVFMCGFPLALGLAPVVPVAAPVPRADWASGKTAVSLQPDRARRRPVPYARRHVRWTRRMDRRALALRVQRVSPPSARLPHAAPPDPVRRDDRQPRHRP